MRDPRRQNQPKVKIATRSSVMPAQNIVLGLLVVLLILVSGMARA